jgi:hypothetical protein
LQSGFATDNDLIAAKDFEGVDLKSLYLMGTVERLDLLEIPWWVSATPTE